MSNTQTHFVLLCLLVVTTLGSLAGEVSLSRKLDQKPQVVATSVQMSPQPSMSATPSATPKLKVASPVSIASASASKVVK